MIEISNRFLGSAAALGTAVIWPFAMLFFSKLNQRMHPIEVNLLKNILAIGLFGTLIIITKGFFAPVPKSILIIFAISGILGIVIGDTLYLKAIQNIGIRNTLLVGMSAPLFTALLSAIFLGEVMSFQAWFGVLITIMGVSWVITERNNENFKFKFKWYGVGLAVIASLGHASGSMMSRWGYDVSNLAPALGSFIRLASALLILSFVLVFRKEQIGTWLIPSSRYKTFLYGLGATIPSSFLGMWMLQFAFKTIPAGTAHLLSNSSPIFGLLFFSALGEKLTLRALIGVIIAFLGIAILFIY